MKECMKMQVILLCAVCFLSQAIAVAQNQYSYFNDRRFFDPTELIGYTFTPDLMEIPDKDISRPLSPGAFSFGIAPNNLYVIGEQIEGLYNVNQINTTEYGFQLVLLDTYDPGKKGHLKIIQTPYGYVEALIFRRSQLEPEMVFFLPSVSENLESREKEWFTDLREAVVPSPDSLYGMVFKPFLRIQDKPRFQQRLRIADSTEIRFIEEVEIIEKVKKLKRKKGEEPPSDSLQTEVTSIDSSAYDIQQKIIRKFFVEVRIRRDAEIGGREDVLWREEIKNISEKSDELAKGMEEKYLIQIETEKGNEYALFLTAERTFSSFEFGDQVFFARGR